MRRSLVRRSIALAVALILHGCGGDSGTDPGDGGGNGGGAPPPLAPSNLQVFAQGPERIAVRWTDNSADETGFEVERSLEGQSSFERVATVDADSTRFIDLSLDADTGYEYRVRALGAGESSAFSASAGATTLPARDPTADFECEREGYPCTWPEVDPEVFDESDRLGDEALLRFDDDGESVAQVSDWLRSLPEVANVIENEVAIRFRLFGGRPTWVFGPDALALPDGAAVADARPGPPAPPPPARAVVGDDPKAKRALVLSVYEFQLGPWDPSGDIVSLLESARGYEGRVEYLANSAEQSQISIDQFKGWGSYQAVHVFTHGTQICQGGACQAGVRAGPSSRTIILNSEDAGVDLAKVEYGDQQTTLSTDFFKQQYPQGLPDTIVFISACKTAEGNDLAEALTGSGGTYLGWTDVVWADTARDAARAFFKILIEKGIAATEAFLSLREDDLTLDRANRFGQFAALDIYQGGEDLRIREVVYPQNPLTKQDLPQDAPYPVVGVPEDGNPDRIPYLVKVDGVEGNPGGFTVHVTVNGFSAEPRSLAEGEMVDDEGNVWRLKGTVAVPFDAQQGQEVDIDVRVELPEGGESKWDESPELRNPEIRFRSSIESVGGVGPVVRLFSEVEAEFKLSLDEELEKLEGEDVLRYPTFDLTVPNDSGCSITNVRTTEGVLQVVDGSFEIGDDDEPVLPERLVMLIPGGVGTGPQEFYTAVCPGGSGDMNLIHYFSGFYSFHGGQLCGSANEVDESAGGLVIRDWTEGQGEVWARREYDRGCTVEEVTFTEKTTIELRVPEGD